MVYDDMAHHIEECMDHVGHAHLHDPRGLSMSSPHLFVGLAKMCSCDHVSIDVAKRQWPYFTVVGSTINRELPEPCLACYMPGP